jgi:toluene monooxygenase system ferredoxin subunit
MGQRIRVCTLDDLWEGEMRVVTIANVEVLIVHTSAGVRAYHPRCPHQAIPLVDGDFQNDVLVCSAHRWQFDAISGLGVNPKNCRLTSYAVDVVGDEIFVFVPSQVPAAAPT